MSHRSWALAAMMAAGLWFLLSASSSPPRAAAPDPPATPYSNPVLPGDYPDPTVVRVGGEWWASATSSAAAPGLPILRSTDLVHWEQVGQVFPTLPGWASDSFWAPHMMVAPRGGMLLYYTARKRNGSLCVAVATAPAAEGPYTDRGPLICQRLGSIDATVVADRGGSWLVWKEDGNSAGRPTRLWAKALMPDGLALTGRKRLLMSNGEPWDGGIVEAPEFIRHGPWLYLFYSGNTCCTPPCRYAMGVARARSIFGSWRRDPRNPILSGNRTWRCPGHGALATLPNGDTMLLYHAYRSSDRALRTRYGLLDRVRWRRDGWPSINAGRGPSSTGRVPGA